MKKDSNIINGEKKKKENKKNNEKIKNMKVLKNFKNVIFHNLF